MAETQSDCRLILVTTTGASALDRLSAALGAGADIASVIIATGGQNADPEAVKPLIAAAQKAGAAALLQDDPRLARTLKADGVHLSLEADDGSYAEAREILGSRFIVGADAGHLRDTAMRLGEAGADYVAFGLPEAQDIDTARERRLDLVQWWAEIFEVPVVALDVGDTLEAEDLARAGSDFVTVRLDPSQSPADARDIMLAMSAAINPATR